MHNLGIGGIDFPEKHTLDQHRPNGYKAPEVTFDEEATTTSYVEPTSGMTIFFYINHHLLSNFKCMLTTWSLFLP